MYDKRAEKDAKRFGILDKMQALEDDLMKIDGIANVEFDIRDYADIHYVILVPKYSFDTGMKAISYYDARSKQLKEILETCEKHSLFPSGDSIEDMGAHWYIVRRCDKSWPRVKLEYSTQN